MVSNADIGIPLLSLKACLSYNITILIVYSAGINVNASINVRPLTERASKSASIFVTQTSFWMMQYS